MPSDPNNPFIECANCGLRGKMTMENRDGRLVKTLPEGWTKEENTYNGAAYFCSPSHEKVWKSKREWAAPLPPLVQEAPVAVVRKRKPPRLKSSARCECGQGPFKSKQSLSRHRTLSTKHAAWLKAEAEAEAEPVPA